MARLVAALMALPLCVMLMRSFYSFAKASVRHEAGMHAVTGVVETRSASVLVLAGSPRHPAEWVLHVLPSTEWTGEIQVGSRVSVRYYVDRQGLTATAVSGRPEVHHHS
jgi:hypothetical protein